MHEHEPDHEERDSPELPWLYASQSADQCCSTSPGSNLRSSEQPVKGVTKSGDPDEVYREGEPKYGRRPELMQCRACFCHVVVAAVFRRHLLSNLRHHSLASFSNPTGLLLWRSELVCTRTKTLRPILIHVSHFFVFRYKLKAPRLSISPRGSDHGPNSKRLFLIESVNLHYVKPRQPTA
jgi:hypothetical protein